VVLCGSGAAPATIDCWHHERREWARFPAGATGSFELDHVPAGTIDLEFEHPGHTVHKRRGVRVEPGQVVDLDTIELALAGSLSGTVTGPTGLSPDGCELTVFVEGVGGADDERQLAEYAAGTYRFAALPPGRHTLQVQGTGLAAATFSVTIEAGIDKQQDIVLAQGVRRRIVVHAPADAGQRVALALRPANAPMRWLSMAPIERTAANQAGTAEFVAYMAPGSYEALAWTRSGHRADGQVQFTYDDEPAVELWLSR
jgi:hypothetical protein